VSKAKSLSFLAIGLGVYSIAEAAHLTEISPYRIRRWTKGYKYEVRGKRRSMPPIIGKEIPGDEPILTFADLIEVRFLNGFYNHGVKGKALRVASYKAQELLGRPRPFSTRIFKTDGIRILAEIVKGTDDRVLLDFVKGQYAFDQIVSPYLFEGLEFNDLNEPKLWWPMGQNRSVVLDPQRAFGAPIIARRGIPTRVLNLAFNAEQSFEAVAKWYGVDVKEVEDAREFELKLAA
jgi:uncharacterized protein (DUF433 family)